MKEDFQRKTFSEKEKKKKKEAEEEKVLISQYLFKARQLAGFHVLLRPAK